LTAAVVAVVVVEEEEEEVVIWGARDAKPVTAINKIDRTARASKVLHHVLHQRSPGHVILHHLHLVHHHLPHLRLVHLLHLADLHRVDFCWLQRC
jgi:hypothetical protein